MRDKADMRGFHWTTVLLSAATLLVSVLLIWQCAAIYFEGVGPANLTETGVLLYPMYSREIVAGHMGNIWWGFALWFAALVATVIHRIHTPKQKSYEMKGMRRELEAAASASKREFETRPMSKANHRNAWRALLYVAAAALIVAGIFNGGARDVLIKAINICTECIGFG